MPEMITDWNDVLWERELEAGKVYHCRVVYFDGTEQTGKMRYRQPLTNPTPVNGLERMIVPEMVDIYGIFRVGHAKELIILEED